MAGRKVFHFGAVDGRGDRAITDVTVSGRIRKLDIPRRGRQADHEVAPPRVRLPLHAGKVSAQVLQKLMRHASIKTTMDYYANVDDAVMAAVLGAKRNTLRNIDPIPRASQEAAGDGSDIGL